MQLLNLITVAALLTLNPFAEKRINRQTDAHHRGRWRYQEWKPGKGHQRIKGQEKSTKSQFHLIAIDYSPLSTINITIIQNAAGTTYINADTISTQSTADQALSSTIINYWPNSLSLTTFFSIPSAFKETASGPQTPSTPSAVLSSGTMSVIASTMIPVSIATGSNLHPISRVIPTAIVTGSDSVATINPADLHCGIHGLPVGDYFLAEFAENQAGVPVTPLGCYHFCISIYGIDVGCQSWYFYPEPETLAPRCDLYGGSVADSLWKVNNYIPNVWYDMECGSPI